MIARKVWNAPYAVTNIVQDEYTCEVQLRVLFDEQPSERSKTVTPTPEDYYLYMFLENIWKQRTLVTISNNPLYKSKPPVKTVVLIYAFRFSIYCRSQSLFKDV